MSLRKDAYSWGLIGLVLLLVAIAAFFVIRPYMRPRVTMRLGDAVLTAQVARTDAEREKGLSGVTHLGKNDAMLFVFDGDGKPGMWMKDMKIPIDIIWLDADKKVVYIAKNVSPDTYPEVFTPKIDARYVVEVAAGTVEADNIAVNRTALFDLNQAKGVNG